MVKRCRLRKKREFLANPSRRIKKRIAFRLIKNAAEAAGESVDSYIKKAIDERMAADKTPNAAIRIESPAALPSAHPEAAPVPTGCANQLPSETWTAAEAGSSCTGETVTEFIDRAISEQTRRDDVSLRLGVNPVTGERLEPKGE